jgi:hypothetical protein
LWKRRINDAYTPINIALDPLCTKMKHLFHEEVRIESVKAQFRDKIAEIKKQSASKQCAEIETGGIPVLNTTWEDAPA